MQYQGITLIALDVPKLEGLFFVGSCYDRGDRPLKPSRKANGISTSPCSVVGVSHMDCIQTGLRAQVNLESRANLESTTSRVNHESSQFFFYFVPKKG